jgi:hypothetical protein
MTTDAWRRGGQWEGEVDSDRMSAEDAEDCCEQWTTPAVTALTNKRERPAERLLGAEKATAAVDLFSRRRSGPVE